VGQDGEIMNALQAWRKRLPTPTLAEAARRLGISESQMSRYEAGLRKVAPERVIEFEKITEIPREELRPDIFKPPGKRRA
jgi:DNA-binding transcriptional regulator YdaS (Cro superfamily)